MTKLRVLALAAAAATVAYWVRYERTYPEFEGRNAYTSTLTYGAYGLLDDLDGDGSPDCVEVDPTQRYVMPMRMVPSQEGILKWHPYFQVNSEALKIESQFACDVNGDGIKEIFISEHFPDSAYISVFNLAGERLLQMPAVRGVHTRPPLEYWHATFGYAGVTADPSTGAPILIAWVTTSYDRYPRGVWAYSLADGREVWRYECGAFITGAWLQDFDGDGEPQVLLVAESVDNGANLNGFSDDNSYVFSLDSSGRLLWKRTLGAKFATLRHALLSDPQGSTWRLLALVMRGSGGAMITPYAVLLDPATGATVDSLACPELTTNDSRPSVVATGRGSWVALYGLPDGRAVVISFELDRFLSARTKRIIDRGPLITSCALI